MNFRKTLPSLATGAVLALAAIAAFLMWMRYENAPWTRDAQIQANVVGIAPLVSGPIIEIPLRDNQSVKKGDFLFQIDPAPFQAALDIAQGQMSVAAANFTKASQDLQRATGLFQTKVIDERDFQDSQDAYAAAKAALEAANATVKNAELNLGYTKVFAPVSGYITNFNVSPGTYVTGGSQLFALVDTDTFWVAGYFKETQISNVKEGGEVRITLMGHLTRPFDGVVESIGWAIFVENGSTVGVLPAVQQTIDWVRLPNRFPVRIRITGTPPVPLRIGQTASVSMARAR